VIVAAKNEALVLPVTLQALMDQSDPPDQILVADDGSTDTTDAVMKSLFGFDPPEVGAAQTGHPVVKWLRLSGGGKARAMNAAMTFIDTEVVITVDADTDGACSGSYCLRLRSVFGRHHRGLKAPLRPYARGPRVRVVSKV
jgi:glycosyltransferase involved in cell wall biosynthesis